MNRQLRRTAFRLLARTALSVLTVGLVADCGQDSNTIIYSAYSVGGTVSGLHSGAALVLQNNGGDDLTIWGNGSFTFPSELARGANYSVTVQTQPGSPPQNCTVAAASGAVGTNVSSIAVKCTDTPPAVTPVGTPTGTAVTATMGPAGGSLTSTDSRFTVTVPAGAVASATAISIQAITNNAPGGVGSAYRLTPDGQTFAVPIELKWNYSAGDLSGTAPEFLAVSYQDAQGHWLLYANSTLDSAKGTLTITTDHFTDDGPWAYFYVDPVDASMKPGELKGFSLRYCSVNLLAPLDTSSPAAEYDCGPFIPGKSTCSTRQSEPLCPVSATWNAHLLPGGTGSAGTVSPGNPSAGGASYMAPASAPTPNKVLVGALFTFNGHPDIATPALVTIIENRYLGTFSVTVTASTDFDTGGNVCSPNPVTGSASFSASMEWDTSGDLLTPGSYPVESSSGSSTLTYHVDGTTCRSGASGKPIVIPGADGMIPAPAQAAYPFTATSDGTNITVAAWTPPDIPGCSSTPPKFTITKDPATDKERIDGSETITCSIGPATATGTYTIRLDQQ